MNGEGTMVPAGGTGQGQVVAPVPMMPEQIQMANFIPQW